MENQHRKIKGYRELTQAEIDLMNEIKHQGLVLEALCEKAKAHIKSQRMSPAGTMPEEIEEAERLDLAQPERWVQVGATHFQQGLMALTRSVAQPTFF